MHDCTEPHKACVVWLTGLSGAGKSTIAQRLRTRAQASGLMMAVLDGDEVRAGLSSDLGFGAAGRRENIRRIAEVARLLSSQGQWVVVAAIAPLREHRALAREIIGEGYREVYVDAPLALCEQRDVKGLYGLARRGQVRRFTGVTDLYEPPPQPDLRVDTVRCDVETAVDLVMASLMGMEAAASGPA